MLPVYTCTTTTQTIELDRQPSLQLRLSTPFRLSQEANVNERIRLFIEQILTSKCFTENQKEFAKVWENHFIRLLTHKDTLVPAKALCFLGIKVITPLMADHPSAIDELIPIARAHRELIALFLPKDRDVEEFIVECEEVHSLMLETVEKLNVISAISEENEQLILQNTIGIHEKILSDSNRIREILFQMIQQWQLKISAYHDRLCRLTEQADILNARLQEHAGELESMGTQLANEQRAFQKSVEQLKLLLRQI